MGSEECPPLKGLGDDISLPARKPHLTWPYSPDCKVCLGSFKRLGPKSVTGHKSSLQLLAFVLLVFYADFCLTFYNFVMKINF